MNTAAGKHPSASLQWGRTREGAETGRASTTTPRHQKLQWGRTREGAETGCASKLQPVYVLLQWGRTREGAETRVIIVAAFTEVTLQWGRTREGAETAGDCDGCGQGAAGFNGAAPVKVRKLGRYGGAGRV